VNILIEGPRWTGLWTEIIADSLQRLGHRVDFCHHNHKGATDRLALAAGTLLGGEDRAAAWRRRYLQRLAWRCEASPPDLLLSIQGKLDNATASLLRKQTPALRVIFWWGDILTDKGLAAIRRTAGFADRLLVSYRGTYEKLKPVYGDQLRYFPFGVSPEFHASGGLSHRERRRFAADVAFVGTCYPERCDLIRELNRTLDHPVSVWGRGWRRCRGVRGRGVLTLRESLKVHACSKISLNLHHRDTDNGCNMKFFEIPAAGGFQLCDRQPVMDTIALGRQTVTCGSLADFTRHIRYYLAHPAERERIAAAARDAVFATAGYQDRLEELLQELA
jgi:spore maturation protein CgeB